MGLLSKREERLLLKKLKAEIKEGGKHSKVEIPIPGSDPLRFGFSRGTKRKNAHFKKYLRISGRQVQMLARCSLERKWFLGEFEKQISQPGG